MVLVRAMDHAGAERLARRLLDPSRLRTILVVSTPFGTSEPYFDVDALVDNVGQGLDVALLRTGVPSRTLAARLPARTEVYGGAARVYPHTAAWAADPPAAPLRFPGQAYEAGRRTARLAQDALSVAIATAPRGSGGAVSVEGVVESVVAGGARALVRGAGGELVSVAAEATVPGVSLDRVLIPGMTITGELDSGSRQLDIRARLRDPDQSLAGYSVGDVVLVDVVRVDRDELEVLLYPGVPVLVPAEEVTDNPLDDITELVSVGEHLPARVTGRDPWSLRLADVDDDETVLPAPALIEGGPAWLLPAAQERDWEALALTPPGEPWVGGEASRRPGALAPIALPDVRPSTASIPASLERSLNAELAAVTSEAREAQRQLTRVHAELEALERERDRLEQELKRERQASAALRRAAKSHRAAGGIPMELMSLFHDREQGFRTEVVLAWARRFPAAEQVERPLPEYRVGAGFLDSLRVIEGISAAKVVDVVVEVLTGVAEESDARELRPYRIDEQPTSPQRVRQDGATAWRVSLQRNTPAARRLHFWRLADGSIELWDVKDHDDHRH